MILRPCERCSQFITQQGEWFPGCDLKPAELSGEKVDEQDWHLAICSACAGTGCDIDLSAEERSLLDKARVAPGKIKSHFAFQRCELDMTGILAKGEAGITQLCQETQRNLRRGRRGSETRLALFTEWLTHPHIQVLKKTDVEPWHRALCSVDSTVAEVMLANSIPELEKLILEAIPKEGSTRRQELDGLCQKTLKDLSDDLARRRLPDKKTYWLEELELIWYVLGFWKRIGKPKGCMAEEVVSYFERAIPEHVWRPVTSEERDLFAIKDAPPELNGLTADILCHLHEAVSCYGSEGVWDGKRMCYLRRDPFPALIFVSGDSKRRDCMIDGGVPIDAMHLIHIGTENHEVLWDGQFSVKEIQMMIMLLDGKAERSGEYDRKSGQRTRRIEANRWDIPKDSEHLLESLAAFVVPSEYDAEKLRQTFQDPENVCIRKAPWGVTYLHHIQDTGKQKMEKIVMRLMRAHDLTYDRLRQLPLRAIMGFVHLYLRECEKAQN